MPDFKDSQFDYLFSAIADKFPAISESSDTTQFQFTGSPLDANWVKGNDINAYHFANKVAADVNGFYVPNPGSLYNAYTELITSITPGIKYENDPTYTDLLSQKNTYESNRKAAMEQMKIAWQSYKDQNTNPKTGLPDQSQVEWLENPLGGLEYYQDVQKWQGNLDDVTKRMSELIKSFNAALSNAQVNAVSDTNKSNYIKADGSTVKLPEITIEGDLGTDLANWKQYPDDEYDLDVTLTKESVIKSKWITVYRTEVEHHCCSTSTSSTVNTSRIINDNHYKLRVMIKGFQSYEITFGDWYTPTFVNPETAKFSKGAVVTNETFFGAKQGVLHMIPSLVWVMYRPKIELTISTDTYKQTIEGDLNAGVDWVDIMSFRFDCSAGSSLAKVGEETTTITFDTPVLQNPSVFGVTSVKEILASSI